jgi:hypothetical protein
MELVPQGISILSEVLSIVRPLAVQEFQKYVARKTQEQALTHMVNQMVEIFTAVATAKFAEYQIKFGYYVQHQLLNDMMSLGKSSFYILLRKIITSKTITEGIGYATLLLLILRTFNILFMGIPGIIGKNLVEITSIIIRDIIRNRRNIKKVVMFFATWVLLVGTHVTSSVLRNFEKMFSLFKKNKNVYYNALNHFEETVPRTKLKRS